MQVNVHAAKTNLSRLIDRAESGEEVIIAKAGRPVVKLVPVRRQARRVFGSAAGQIVFRKGWEAPLSDKDLQVFLGRWGSCSTRTCFSGLTIFSFQLIVQDRQQGGGVEHY